jgi:hypothetical protein
MKRRLPIITTSEIQCYQRCPRLHQYKYTLGYRPIERAHALGFGSVIHGGLEAWWSTAGEAIAMFAAANAAHKESGLSTYDLVRAEVMLTGYHARWVGEPITVIGVEHEFCVPIRHPAGYVHTLKLAGKWDAICEIDGLVYLPEHKTKSEKVDSEQYFSHLRSNVQVSNYLIAATELGHSPGGALYDVLVKLPEHYTATPEEQRRYRKDGALYARQREQDEPLEEYQQRLTELVMASPDDWYQRAIVVRLAHELDVARLDLWHMANELSADRSYAPRYPDACRAYGRICEFYEVCFGGASLEDSGMFEKVDNVHQELSDAISQAAE